MDDSPRGAAGGGWAERILHEDPAPDVHEALAGVRAPARVIEEFRPVSESLEWRLAEAHWRRAGTLPFAENEVPFLVNNSGRLSEAAARLLLASCLESSLDSSLQGGEPPASTRAPLGDDRPITVLELGAGSGLFALLLLDRFRAMCAAIGRDFYERLTYVVSDASPATVRDWNERSLFAAHAGHVTCVVAGALEPALPGGGPLQALFCNYVLDVLPAAIVRRGADGHLQQLCVRVHLVNDPPRFPADAPQTLDDIQALASSGDEEGLARLLPVMSAFEYEIAFRRDGADVVPGAAEAADASPEAARVRLSVGALRCLARGAARLAPGGFILVNDYGPVTPAETATFAVAQRFGRTIGSGLNFPWLERELGRLGLSVHKPAGDDARQLHARLIVRGPAAAAERAFEEQFSEAAHRHLDGPIDEARLHAAAGRKEEALGAYRLALSRSPGDWALVGEIAEFLNGQLGDFGAAADLALAALKNNPHYSTWLWNLLGDALYNLGRAADAHQAYLQAERVNPRDPGTLLNLAFTYLAAGEHGRALGALGRGLENDARGLFRERLLDKQRQVLAAISARWADEQERLARRNQRFA
jgi:tetratricopeptide (TPR) repeat protein